MKHIITIAHYPPNSHYVAGEVTVEVDADNEKAAVAEAIRQVKSMFVFAIEGERFEAIRMEVDGLIYTR